MNVVSRLLVVALCGYLPLATWAQDQERENLRAVGTLRAVAVGGFQMATDTNETWNVKLPAKPTEVSFSGTADQTFLRPGMKVTFSALMNRKGIVQGPVTSLTVFTPLEPKDIGVWPDSEGEGAPNPLEGLFSEKEVKKEVPKKGAKKVVEDQVCRVGGTLKSLKGNRLIVVAGNREVKCELAENAKIKVATSDLSFARQGDKVEMEGWYYANQKQAAWANSVSVTAANTLQAEKKKSKTGDDDAPTEKEPKGKSKSGSKDKADKADKDKPDLFKLE